MHEPDPRRDSPLTPEKINDTIAAFELQFESGATRGHKAELEFDDDVDSDAPDPDGNPARVPESVSVEEVSPAPWSAYEKASACVVVGAGAIAVASGVAYFLHWLNNQ